jgi:hypothetical protein
MLMSNFYTMKRYKLHAASYKPATGRNTASKYHLMKNNLKP